MRKNIKVWECKIVIEADKLPNGFDFPPRKAAQKAIEDAGFTVIMNASGWGARLNEYDIKYLEEHGYKNGSDIYIAGLPDISEDIKH